MHITYDQRAQAQRELRAMRRLVVAPVERNAFAGAGVTFAIVFLVAFVCL